MSNTSSEKWLVRSEKNQITGPYAREKLRQMILEGQLGLQDEVCAGNSYWITLNEPEEVRAQLDVIVSPPAKKLDEEDTQTETVHSVSLENFKSQKKESAEIWRCFAFFLVLAILVILMSILSRFKA